MKYIPSLFFILFCVILLPTQAAVQQDPKYQRLQKEMVSVSKDLRLHEKNMNQSEKKLAELDQARDEILKALTKRHAQLQGLVTAIQHLAKRGPSALIETVRSVDDLIRSAMTLKSLITAVVAGNKELQQELQRLNTLRLTIQTEQGTLKRAKEDLSKQSEKLDILLTERKVILEREREQQRKIEARVKTLAAQSSNVHDLIVQLKKQKPPTKAVKKALPSPVLTGLQKDERYVMLPIQGEVIVKYGKTHELNLDGVGVVFKARPGARVLSPVNGQVVFAGPFRRYSQIVIIAHNGKYHTLLAGMKQVDTATGQQVIAGEPIGVMSRDKGDKPHLYLELRRDSTPVDPSLWISEV